MRWVLLLLAGCTGGVPYVAPDDASDPSKPGFDLVEDAESEDAESPDSPPGDPSAGAPAPAAEPDDNPGDAPAPLLAPDGDPGADEEGDADPGPVVIPLPGASDAPGDKPGQATPLEAGVEVESTIEDGSDVDYWRVDSQGPWRIDVFFSHNDGDLDVYVWDIIAGARKTDRSGRPVGSDSDNDDEEFVFRLPAVIRVQGWEGATAPYRIRLTEL